MDKGIGLTLIEDLKNSPKKFYDEGKSYDLLQEYYSGLSIDTLRPLFDFECIWIRRVAIWIASELGTNGRDLLREVSLQTSDNDVYIFSYAIEIIANCTDDDSIDSFMNIFSFITNPDREKRVSVMSLVGDMSEPCLRKAYKCFATEKYYNASHEKGISSLLNSETLTADDITNMINDEDAIVRKYGIIIAGKLYDKYADIINEAVNSNDLDIREYSELTIRASAEFERIISEDILDK